MSPPLAMPRLDSMAYSADASECLITVSSLHRPQQPLHSHLPRESTKGARGKGCMHLSLARLGYGDATLPNERQRRSSRHSASRRAATHKNTSTRTPIDCHQSTAQKTRSYEGQNGRSRRGGRGGGQSEPRPERAHSVFLSARARVTGLPNRASGSVTHPRGRISEVRACTLFRGQDATRHSSMRRVAARSP
ncbi:hypothetical protein PYCCODRAFT_1132143 [Trametes coccinea BRFM310]|uniref:Uncharacterized protein n=1 Tax=Trametes coccinea (strain BRFM310) TaxID=1353009 RepID=A0A1Y2IAN7_TRAC3|nr:hypothetical protein PYCCODRAFT_1132143 [Trametes coccinea BRFM310]